MSAFPEINHTEEKEIPISDTRFRDSAQFNDDDDARRGDH